MAKLTLDDIKAAADRKYASLEVDLPGGPVELVNVLRLSKEKRAAFQSLQDRMQAEGAEVDDLILEGLCTVARTKEQADRLAAEIGTDMALCMVVFEEYGKETEVGEASASAV